MYTNTFRLFNSESEAINHFNVCGGVYINLMLLFRLYALYALYFRHNCHIYINLMLLFLFYAFYALCYRHNCHNEDNVLRKKMRIIALKKVFKKIKDDL
jgi:hypothetical protein